MFVRAIVLLMLGCATAHADWSSITRQPTGETISQRSKGSALMVMYRCNKDRTVELSVIDLRRRAIDLDHERSSVPIFVKFPGGESMRFAFSAHPQAPWRAEMKLTLRAWQLAQVMSKQPWMTIAYNAGGVAASDDVDLAQFRANAHRMVTRCL